MASYKQEIMQELSTALLSQGYRVFIAESGDYGFFTNQQGERVISITADLTASGNYSTSKPKQTGTGWRIADNIDMQVSDADNIFNTDPPRWAVGNAECKLTTLENYLKTYHASSKFVEQKTN